MKRLSLVGRVTVLAAAVAIGVGVMFVAALLAILSLRAAEKQEKQSAARTVATLRVENLSVDVVSAVRGYALSRDARFLDLYHSARDRLPDALKELDAAAAGDVVQAQRAADARAEIDGYLNDYADPVIALTSFNPEAARSEAASRENARRAADIRTILGRITTLEGRRSSSRSAHVHADFCHAAIDTTLRHRTERGPANSLIATPCC